MAFSGRTHKILQLALNNKINGFGKKEESSNTCNKITNFDKGKSYQTIDNGSVWTPMPFEYERHEFINDNELANLKAALLPSDVEVFKSSNNQSEQAGPSTDDINDTRDILGNSTQEILDYLLDSDDEEKDPNFVLEDDLSPNTSDIEEKPPTSEMKKGGKKRTAEPQKWKENVAKKRRNFGEMYESKHAKKVVSARVIKDSCKKCKYACSDIFSQGERESMFNNFWKIGDLEKQREFIARHISTINCEKEHKSRGLNCAYYFSKNNNKIRVCKHFFMTTLGINSRIITTVKNKKNNTGFIEPDHRGKHNNHKKVPESIKYDMRNHINSIPRIESHYLRSQTSKQYIDGGKTLVGIYRDYVKNCQNEYKPYGTLGTFSKIFNTEFNISFFIPKKDLCDLCAAYQNTPSEMRSSQEKENYEIHLKEKELSRKEKEADKSETSSNVIVSCYDLQAVLPAPSGDTSVFYYTSKLATYNLTVYELKNGRSVCNVWHEGEAKRGSIEIATCIYNYIKCICIDERPEEELEFIFYTDNCGGQQKNRYVFTMYMYVLYKFKNIKSITHKFLIRGHTQNEGDSFHSTIEKEIKRARKSGPIYTPEQYIQLIRSSKKNPPYYIVKEYSYKDFLNFKQLSDNLGKNFNCNSLGEHFNFNDIKVFKVCRDNIFNFLYKISNSDEFKNITVYGERKKSNRKNKKMDEESNEMLLYNEKLAKFDSWNEDQAYKNPLGVPAKKKKKFMFLINKKQIPNTYFNFFDSLREIKN